ncbi:general secretion pathway protein H [Sphingobium sp. YR657]|uniref:Type II secretion system protein H n=3 Tax=Sphingomonadaceae TaxID=41297 RepID=K9D0Q6_SPHYA|nr:general secretion pathway protein H [Sphingobium yanoikuyae ATCC 51230]SHM24431.1 general secretion pathway protein H [Sphingobium sp. YR657]
MAVADRWISPAVILTKVRIHSALRLERSAEWIPDQVRDDDGERGGRSAQQGFMPLERYAEHGFTLIELMVVLTIIGFISAAVVIAIPDPRGRIVDDADRFAARVAAARDEAVVTARPMGVWVSASGYGFQRREGGQWVPMEEKPFVSANWKTGTRALVGQDGRQQIAFDGTGLPTDPLTITLAREAERVQVSVDMAGKVAVGG